jgi:hypothetical protein
MYSILNIRILFNMRQGWDRMRTMQRREIGGVP